MNRDNIIAILGILKTAYPRFYANMSKSQAEEAIALWQEMFSDTDIRILTIAVKRLITHLEFPPTIADVKKEIFKITAQKKSDINYWQDAFEMMSNANYMTQEEFEKYPEICKRFFGSLTNLKPYGMIDKDYVINNIQSRFLKFAENYQKEEQENLLLPQEYKKLVDNVVNNLKVKSLEG